MKKALLLAVIILCTFCLPLLGQQTICKEKYQDIRERALKTVYDYTRLLEVLAAEQDAEASRQITAKILALAESDKIVVEDDISSADQQFVGKKHGLSDYLNNLLLYYKGTADVVFTIGEASEVMHNKTGNFYFITVASARTFQGTFYDHTNTPIAVPANERNIDFILKIEQLDKLIPQIKLHAVVFQEDLANRNTAQQQIQTLRLVDCPKEVKPIQVLIQEDSVLRRGFTYSLEWQGGVKDDTLLVELYRVKKGDLLLRDTIVSNYENRGYYNSWHLPGNTKPGNYKIKITKTNVNEAPKWSAAFRIKRKTPSAYKAGGIIVAGGLAFLLLQKEEAAVPSSDLPLPPSPE